MGEVFGVCVAVGVQQELLQHSGVGAEEEGSVQSPGKSKQEEQWGCSRKDVQCPKGRSGLPEPGPTDFGPPNTALPFSAGEGVPTHLTPRYPGMAVGAEGCPHVERGWGTVGRHKERTAHRQALRVGGSEHTAQRDGEQPRHGLGRTAGMGGFILASCGAAGLWCPQSSTPVPCEASCLSLLPAALAGSCPASGTIAGHGLSPRPPSTPRQPHRRGPWSRSRVLGEARPCPRVQDEGWSVGSRAGRAGGPAEPSCRDVAGMCVGGTRGGGEGGRGSSRGSSSFDKQLPEHFQTVVSDRHARGLRRHRQPRGRQVGSPRPGHAARCTGDSPGSAGPVPGGRGHVHVEGQPQAGLGCWAGDVSTPPEVLPWAPRLARASPRCFLAGQLLEWEPGLSLLRISPGAAPAEQLLWSCLDGEHPAWGVGMV